MTTTAGRVPMVTPADDVPGPEQGHWTYQEYAALPDDGRRYEIIGGVLYMSPSPSEAHQSIVTRLVYHLFGYVELGRRGRVYVSPFDVELALDDVVQPDVLVLLNAHLNRITPSRVRGAPDLVVEVVFPGSSTQDRHVKFTAYARAGVSEYWLIEPFARTIELFTLEAGEYRSLGVYEGAATLPSRVLPGFLVKVKEFS
jgi:Uma2 family endonuclease